jgi:hypothetical protein
MISIFAGKASRPLTAADELPAQALGRDGLLVRRDGALLRYLSVVPNNPLVLDESGCDRMTKGLVDALLRVPPGMSLQFYAQGDPVSREQLVARMRSETDGATAELVASGDTLKQAQGSALRTLAAMREEGFLENAEAQAALDLRFVLVVCFDPAQQTRGGSLLPGTRRRERDPLARTLTQHAAFARDSASLTEQLRTSLQALGLYVEHMDGPAVADLLWSRLAPTKCRAIPGQAPSAAPAAVLSSLDTEIDADQAVAAAAKLRRSVAQGAIDFRPARHVVVDGQLEQVGYVSKRPERTFYGWLLHGMQCELPWTLSMHVSLRDRGAERERFRRRERMLWGLNSGETGRPNRAQHEHEAEASSVADELAAGGESIADVSIYLSVRDPDPAADARGLADTALRALRALASPVEAGVQQGEFQQPDLWRSSLPIGVDAARRRIPLLTRNVADSLPFVSTDPGSPDGIPFALSEPGRSVVRINPYDERHPNAITLVPARSGKGKTMMMIDLIIAAITRGAQASVIDRSTGHYEWLCRMIPGVAHLHLGDENETTAINCWDVADPARIPRDKVQFLLHLHAMLIGDHDAAGDSFGLDRLQRSLLAHAIRSTYRRAARTGALPREALLHGVLGELAELEAEHAPEHAAIYRDLAIGVSELCGEGTYAYLFDRPTSLPGADAAPLIVFNTERLPEAVAPGVLFSVFEYLANRTSSRWSEHKAKCASGYMPSSPLEGSSLIVFEEVWKVVDRKSTAQFVTERARRGRHTGLWVVALSQSARDLANANAAALVDNATMHIILGQGLKDIALLRAAVGLSDEEVEQITRLTTEKRVQAQAYFVNGDRGRGTIAIRLAAAIYWIATSEPRRDMPLKERALRDAGGDYYTAVALLLDRSWHEAPLAA